MTFCPTCYIINIADGSIAQLGEHLPYKQRVTGSSPVVPTKIKRIPTRYPFYFYVIRCNARNCDKILQILRTTRAKNLGKTVRELFCSIFVSYKSPVLIISFLFMGENFAPPLKICRTAVRQILYYF